MRVTKVWADKDENLLVVTKDAMKQALDIKEEDLESESEWIKAISCKSCDLTALISHPRSTMGNLDSMESPIFRHGVDVILPPIVYELSAPAPSSKKAKTKSAIDVLLGRAVLKLKYLQYEWNVDKPQEIDEQCKEKVYEIYEAIGLGHDIPRQKKQLETNAMHVKNAMCFIQKHWKVLVRAEYPNIPDSGEDFIQSKVLITLAETSCKKKST